MTNREKAIELREKGYTLKAIAYELNLTISTISRILNIQDSPIDTSEFIGISWDKYARRYIVRLRNELIGRYKSINDAVYFRNKKAISLWGYNKAVRDGYIHDPITLKKMEN